MKRMICGKRVTGASHIRAGKPCQDSYRYLEISDQISILAVADGHGSDSCPFSGLGALMAVNTFCFVIEKLLKSSANKSPEFLISYLHREGELGIAQAIEKEWKRRVRRSHFNHKRERPLDAEGKVDKAAVYRLYGTTLLGLLITPDFLFAFQIGDGDILKIDAGQVQPVIEADKILGTETHSLSSHNSWRKAITVVRNRDETLENPHLYLMTTDGFANSYPSAGAFEETCQAYFEMIQTHGFDSVAANLEGWLKETSAQGCGDDITVVMVYYS